MMKMNNNWKNTKYLDRDFQNFIFFKANSFCEYLVSCEGYQFIHSSDSKISNENLNEFEFVLYEKFFLKRGKIIPYKYVFKHKTLDVYLVLNKYKPDKKNYVINEIYWGDLLDPELALNTINALIDKIKKNKGPKISIIYQEEGIFKSHNQKINIPSIDIDKMYNDNFKSYHDIIVESINSKNKGLIILHGIPGTGKSSYIANLTTITKKDFIFVPVNMISELTNPQFISFLYNHKNSVLVLEDCESFINKRTGSNFNSIIPNLLNITDGLLSEVLNMQIIVTFNSNIIDVDPALLRKGRLICSYEFDKLSSDKADILLEELGKPPKGISLALSDIFFSEETIISNIEQKKIGFK